MTYLRRVLLPGLVVVAVATAVAGSTGGAAAAWSALGGGLAVVALLVSTPFVLGPVVSAMPGLSFAAAVTFYLTKVSLLAAALVVIGDPEVRAEVHVEALGGAMIATTLAWTVLLVVAELRSRRPVYDLP